MRPSTLVVLLAVCTASRLSRDSEEESLAEAFNTLTFTESTVETLAGAINTLYKGTGKNECELEKERKKIGKFIVPHCNQLDALDKEISLYMRDVFSFFQNLAILLKRISQRAPNGIVTKSILESKMTKKQLKIFQSAATEYSNRLSQLRRRETSLLADQDLLIVRECDTYKHRLTKNVETLAATVQSNFKETAMAYVLFEVGISNAHRVQDGPIKSIENIYVSRLLDFDSGPINTLISLTKTFSLEAFNNLIADLDDATRNIYDRARSISTSSLMRAAHTNRRIINRLFVAETLAQAIASSCSYESLNAARTIKKTVQGTIDLAVFSMNPKVNFEAAAAVELQPAQAPVIESWVEGAMDRVAEFLFAAVATENGESAVIRSKCDPGAIESLKQNIIRIHRDTHIHFAVAKQRRESFAVPAVTADIHTVFHALSIDETAINKRDPNVVEAVAHELASEIALEPSASLATKALDSKLKEQRLILTRLEKRLYDQKMAHTKALESITAAEASVSVYETQLEGLLSPAGVAMDAKTTKKWERAIASHAAAVTSLDQAISLAIATLVNAVNAAGEVTAVKSRIHAIQLAITAVQSARL